MALSVGSLFSGIGGLELGLEWAGHGPVRWQVERDEYCRRVLAKHWPDTTRFRDVRTVGAELESVDIICGGFPCQDLSYAGKGAGIAKGTRSGLWYEFARIVRVVRPRFVVVENVPALLGRGLGIVLGDLAACGYDATWDCIPAAAVGAPHRRDRIFIVGYSNGEGESAGAKHGQTPWLPSLVAYSEGIFQQEQQRSRSHSVGYSCSRTLSEQPETREVLADVSGREQQRFAWWETEPDVGRVADGVPSRVDRLRALGNAVVPQVAQVVGELISQLEEDKSTAAPASGGAG